MIANRSMPPSTVIPVLVYPDFAKAVTWLCDVFGFIERLRIGSHRSQLSIGEGCVVATARPALLPSEVRAPPATYPFGERRYSAENLAGHTWTFSQSIADVDPREWGGTVVTARRSD